MKKAPLSPTESVNPHTHHLSTATAKQLARLFNAEDFNAARAVQKAAPTIARAITQSAKVFAAGGKIIFIGAGTSGRLGVLEAAECVPTFGVRPGQIVGIMAGGKAAMFRSQEGAEDNALQGGKDVLKTVRAGDFVLGIAASGNTPYVLGALKAARQAKCHTALLSCNPQADVTHADIFICLNTGAEALSGSTRMKAGTATKMALNAITTGAMARVGKTYGNLMIDVQATNHKLVQRALRLIRTLTGTDEKTAKILLQAAGKNVKTAVVMHRKQCSRAQALRLLRSVGGRLSEVLHEK